MSANENETQADVTEEFADEGVIDESDGGTERSGVVDRAVDTGGAIIDSIRERVGSSETVEDVQDTAAGVGEAATAPAEAAADSLRGDDEETETELSDAAEPTEASRDPATAQERRDMRPDTADDTAADATEALQDTTGTSRPGSNRGGGGSGPEITDAQQQNIDAAVAEVSPRVTEEQQGVESQSGRVGEQAEELEKQVLESNPNLDASDVRITREGDTLQAETTSTGAEALGQNPTRQERRDAIAQEVTEGNPLDPEDVEVELRGDRAVVRTDVGNGDVAGGTGGSAAGEIRDRIDDVAGAVRATGEELPVAFGAGGASSGSTTTEIADLTGSARRQFSGERDASQGIETGEGRIAEQARQLEQQILERRPDLRPQDIAVRRDDDELEAELTQGGREYARAVARLERDNRTASAGPRDFGDQVVPDSVEGPAEDFAGFVSEGATGFREAGGFQSTTLVPTGDGLAAPGLGGEANPVEEGSADFVEGVGELPSTGIQVGEAGAFVIGGTGLAGGSREETVERSQAVGRRGLEIGEQTLEFAQENPIRFGTSAGLGVATGTAVSRVAGGSRTGLAESVRRTGGTFRSSLPDVEPRLDLDLRRNLGDGRDRGMADFSRSSEDVDTQQQREVTVERGSEEAAEAEAAMEEFLERDLFDVPEGSGPSRSLAEERGLDELEVASEPTRNVQRTALDRESELPEERLPDRSEFESEEAFEAEVEILRERIESEQQQTGSQSIEAEADQPAAADSPPGTTAAEAGAGLVAGSEVATATTFADERSQAEAEVFAEEEGRFAPATLGQETGLETAQDVGVATGVEADQTVEQTLGQGVDLGLGVELDQEVALGQELTQEQELQLTEDLTQEQTTDLTQDQTTDLDSVLDQRLDTSTRLDFETDTPQPPRGETGDSRDEEGFLPALAVDEETFGTGFASGEEIADEVFGETEF